MFVPQLSDYEAQGIDRTNKLQLIKSQIQSNQENLVVAENITSNCKKILWNPFFFQIKST